MTGRARAESQPALALISLLYCHFSCLPGLLTKQLADLGGVAKNHQACLLSTEAPDAPSGLLCQQMGMGTQLYLSALQGLEVPTAESCLPEKEAETHSPNPSSRQKQPGDQRHQQEILRQT